VLAKKKSTGSGKTVTGIRGISSSGFKTDKFDMINDLDEDIELQDSYKR
jgi:hypothetical protein